MLGLLGHTWGLFAVAEHYNFYHQMCGITNHVAPTNFLYQQACSVSKLVASLISKQFRKLR
jgi:hypothetical protein